LTPVAQILCIIAFVFSKEHRYAAQFIRAKQLPSHTIFLIVLPKLTYFIAPKTHKKEVSTSE